ncbi:hypothetical protein OIU78_028583 [Salix suchowensis]|nr:hypothetical protein OIU78_028583 [Salix suchowensis]
MSNIDMANIVEIIAAWKEHRKLKISFCSKKIIHHCMHIIKI